MKDERKDNHFEVSRLKLLFLVIVLVLDLEISRLGKYKLTHTHNYTPARTLLIMTATTLFRPCIDLHAGVVKQIVGGTLTDDNDDGDGNGNHATSLQTNFTAE